MSYLGFNKIYICDCAYFVIMDPKLVEFCFHIETGDFGICGNSDTLICILMEIIGSHNTVSRFPSVLYRWNYVFNHYLRFGILGNFL